MTDGAGGSRPDIHPVLGLYGPATQMWRINREAVLLGAGPCALLLQLAHPMVAEGVSQHSDFEREPWGRLRRTLRTTLAMVFGDGREAAAAIRRLNRVHAGVRGDVDDPEARRDGASYRALDPALLLWVQATLVMTSVRAYERWVGPLQPGERETFWQESRRGAARLGIPLDTSPASWEAFEAYWEAMLAPGGPVHVTPTARRLARSILRPPVALLPGMLAEALVLPSLALLPPRVRLGYAVPWNPLRERLAATLDLGVRAWTRALPPSWRSMPQARAAFRRTGRSGVPCPPTTIEPT